MSPKKRRKKPSLGKRGIAIGKIGIVVAILIFVFGLIFNPVRKDVKEIKQFLMTYSISGEKREIALVPKGTSPDVIKHINQFEKNIEKIESFEFFSLNSETYFQISSFYFDYFKFKKSYEYVNKALKKDPKNVEGLVLRGALNLLFGSTTEAKNDIQLAINCEIEDEKNKKVIPSGYLFIAFLSYLEGDIKDSIELLKKSINSLSESKDLEEILLFNYYLLESFYLDLSQYDKSIYFYEKMSELKENIENSKQQNELTYLILGIIEIENSPEAAKIYFNLLSSQTKNNPFFENLDLLSRAIAALSDDKIEESISYINQSREIARKNEVNIFEYLMDYMLFMLLEEKNRKIEWNILDRMKKSNINFPLIEADIFSTIGLNLANKKEYYKAIASYKSSLDIFTNSELKKEIASAFMKIGTAHFLLRNYSDANKSFDRALNEINDILTFNKEFLKKSYSSKKIKRDIDELLNMKNEISPIKEFLESILSQ